MYHYCALGYTSSYTSMLLLLGECLCTSTMEVSWQLLHTIYTKHVCVHVCVQCVFSRCVHVYGFIYIYTIPLDRCTLCIVHCFHGYISVSNSRV